MPNSAVPHRMLSCKAVKEPGDALSVSAAQIRQPARTPYREREPTYPTNIMPTVAAFVRNRPYA